MPHLSRISIKFEAHWNIHVCLCARHFICGNQIFFQSTKKFKFYIRWLVTKIGYASPHVVIALAILTTAVNIFHPIRYKLTFQMLSRWLIYNTPPAIKYFECSISNFQQNKLKFGISESGSFHSSKLFLQWVHRLV